MLIYFNFYRQTAVYSWPLALLGTALAGGVALFLLPLQAVFLLALNVFIFIASTIGFLLSLLIYHLLYHRQYYFYYNYGISRRRLFFCAFLQNVVVLAAIRLTVGGFL